MSAHVIWIRPEAIQSFHSLGDDLAACFWMQQTGALSSFGRTAAP